MAHNIFVIVLLKCIMQVHSELHGVKRVATYRLASCLTNKMLDRAPEIWPLKHADLDITTLGKYARHQRVSSATRSSLLHSALPTFHHQSANAHVCAHCRSLLRQILAAAIPSRRLSSARDAKEKTDGTSTNKYLDSLLLDGAEDQDEDDDEETDEDKDGSEAANELDYAALQRVGYQTLEVSHLDVDESHLKQDDCEEQLAKEAEEEALARQLVEKEKEEKLREQILHREQARETRKRSFNMQGGRDEESRSFRLKQKRDGWPMEG
eukprot:gnl/TRDRNA2_/TRDRNA2_125499_c0_seq3.p1 gnl/TRDRNA2_/TRDRNA2_125499_c0~~gnl/TRDRNA2_/TRDRNA2_125499_c0_seq3.p1  ORF type:complete len:267 (+),score=52.54 gnl/TRDRNA2_/TRDRNA2_125499_c0_seq3:114-914(+)